MPVQYIVCFKPQHCCFKRYVQFSKMNMIPLVNKHYWNRVILRGQSLSLNYWKSLDQIMFQKSFRSFKSGTASLFRSKGCKVGVCQTLRLISFWRTLTTAPCFWFDSCRMVGFFSHLQLWQLVALQSFNPQQPKIPLWKELNLFCWHSPYSRTYKHFKDSFCLKSDPISIVFIYQGYHIHFR